MAEASLEDFEQALRLLEQGLFMKMYGERPPGAPPTDLTAETWPRWCRNTETFLRRVRGD